MTVTYGDAPFIKLLFRWRGSVWKQVWKKYLIYLVLFFAIQSIYRFCLPENTEIRKQFERMVIVFDKWSRVIPIQFLLGFYVSSVVARWWSQLNSIAWPDKFLLFVVTNLQGKDTETRKIRRTFARWCILLSVLVWKEICLKIKKRFPSDEHLKRYQLMTEEEYEIFKKTSGDHGRWFVPVSWMANLIARMPFGEGDEDFDMNYVLDRNTFVANMLVDELHDQQVETCKDPFWDIKSAVLPHTKASYPGDKVPNWRLSKTKVKQEDMNDWDDIFKDVKVEEKTLKRSKSVDDETKDTCEMSEQAPLAVA